MKVVILAGGFGTRISEYTKTIPKPMIKIKNTPILRLIINQYKKYGFKDFYIALGYKGNLIKKFTSLWFLICLWGSFRVMSCLKYTTLDSGFGVCTWRW